MPDLFVDKIYFPKATPFLGPSKQRIHKDDIVYVRADLEEKKRREAYIAGYEQGHHDTVESAYSDAGECADDWMAK